MRTDLRARQPERLEPAAIGGRVPPHDLDAEAAVLSAILLSREALDRVLEILMPEHFYSDANAHIYAAMQQLALQGSPIDVISVASYLRDRERLGQIGGPAYLVQIADTTPAVANVGAHAQVVYEKWRVRALIATCQHIAAHGYGDVGAVQSFIDDAEQRVYELARTGRSTGIEHLREPLRAAFQQVSAASERGDRITGTSHVGASWRVPARSERAQTACPTRALAGQARFLVGFKQRVRSSAGGISMEQSTNKLGCPRGEPTAARSNGAHQWLPSRATAQHAC